MSDDERDSAVELPPVWQLIYPTYNQEESDEEEGTDPSLKADAMRNYVIPAKSAPRLGRLMRMLNDYDDEEMQQVLLDKDPVTGQTLLQWCVLRDHFMLVEYLIKRVKRSAFSFNVDATDYIIYEKWEEMRPSLPSAAEVAERQKKRDEEKAERLAAAAAEDSAEESAEDEDDEEALEPTPEELVYDELPEVHEEIGENGLGVVKQIGELGVYSGARLRDGTKQGLGQSLFVNGDCYAGEYRGNKRSGRGVYWWATMGTIYVGEWLHNMRHGYGRMIYPDGSRYLGQWVHNKKNGKGRYTYADGSSYDGSWVDNNKQGYGVWQFPDGSSFHGSFFNDEFVSGEWQMASGTVRYVGNFSKDVPVGAGIYVHRCGNVDGAFQQEGYYQKGQWHPGVMSGSTKVEPRVEVFAPRQKEKRVPLRFSKDCNGRTMPDLVKVANFPPFLRWLGTLTTVVEDPVSGVEVKSIEVSSMQYDFATLETVVEVRIKPLLLNAKGERLRPNDAETVILKEPVTRLLVILEQHGNSEEERKPVVVLERSLQLVSGDADHLQWRLPTVTVSRDGSISGPFAELVGKALRLSLSRENTKQLVRPLRSNPQNSNAAEEVIMYLQEAHADAFISMQEKLDAACASSDLCHFAVVPLEEVGLKSTDALTKITASLVVARRQKSKIPQGTVPPQRLPTPHPPEPEERPPLEPLYDAKNARAAREEDAEDEA